ncbi:MAG: radical SAM protein [Planctomycetes bacterium]|nr:radical SAM protein [Planctomycetota bacterium]
MNALRYLPFAARTLRRSGPPLHLTLFVTGACNLRCRHCFHWKEVAAGVAGPSLAQIDALAASCERMGPLLWVSLGGGEPFLRQDLAQVAHSFAARGLRHLAIPTNGLVEERLEPFVREVLGRHPQLQLSISVSFDGPPAIHDSIRQVKGGHARSMQAVRRLVALKSEFPNLGVGILVCVTRENQDTLAEHAEELVRELHPDNLTINLARGTALDPSLLEVDIARYEELVARKRALVRSGALPYFDFPLARLAVARDELMYEHVARVARKQDTPHLACTAGTVSAVIFENGDVQPCEVLGASLGNLNECAWDLGELWDGPVARALRERIRRERCKCTWECAQADNVLFRARSWPALAKKVLAP